MKKSLHWFMNKVVVKKGTSGALLILDLFQSESSIQYQEARYYCTHV